jgi:hypothetical protein
MGPGLRRDDDVGNVQTHLRDLAAAFARALPTNFLTLQSEGAGNAGRRCARSRACSVGNTRVSHHGHTGNTRHSPRNGFNGFLRDLPGDRACLSPSSADTANLTPASRRQNHTTSPSAGKQRRQRAASAPSTLLSIDRLIAKTLRSPTYRRFSNISERICRLRRETATCLICYWHVLASISVRTRARRMLGPLFAK